MSLTRALLVVALLTAPAAARQAAESAVPLRLGSTPSPDLDVLRRRQLGVLTFTRVSMSFDQTPARQAFAALRDRLEIPMIGRFADDPVGHGIDPAAPITLSVTQEPARGVLEAMLLQCDRPGAPCTWQLRAGFVEYGTKERLSVPAARVTRLYNIADLIIDVPEKLFVRTRREKYALDLVQEVVETIEPGAWDWGQPLQEPDDLPVPPAAAEPAPTPIMVPAEPQESPAGTAPETAAPPASAPAPAPAAAATRAWPPRRYDPPRRIAIIRYWRDHLVVDGPDYIHRQVAGYPEPIPPPAPEPGR